MSVAYIIDGRMRTFCVVGESGSGKTLLVQELVKYLASKGFRVCTMKHTDLKRFDVEGKDTSKHMEAGAVSVVGVSRKETIMFHRGHDLDEIVKLLPLSDFLIIEGGKTMVCPKILVGEKDVTKGEYVARWKIGEPLDKVVDSIMSLPPDAVQLYVDGRRINIKPFIQRAMLAMLIGFVNSLKGVDAAREELVLKINLKEASHLLRHTAQS
ncbi:MAG: molybdopterin-guanine dinucleotide biosynthesis protein B [Nitrososphaeria archaeon]